MQTTALESSISKKNLQKGKSDCKPSVQNLQSGDNLPIKVETNIQRSLIQSTTIEQITDRAAGILMILYLRFPNIQVWTKIVNVGSMLMVDLHDDSDAYNSGNAPDSPSESSEPTIEDDVNYSEDGSCIPCLKLDDMKDCESMTHTRYLLLTSVSFLNRADELFDLGTCNSRLLQTAQSPDWEMFDVSLLLECAKEILELKSLHCTRTVSPLSQNLRKKPKCHLSLEQLVGEISDVIDNLKNYSKSFGDVILVDSINSMLERDLRWNGKLICAWDLGWKNGLTMMKLKWCVKTSFR
ncbi:UNVERIFIED_CONTAM: hypothetical protein Sangu_1427500 [Sesamum angustifolium]|uniref:Uncharacterized protein n=1 Tax=Sesamum angustifolium TaxID=2727405 RepID=A0AAW2N879_9LAMI